MERILTPGIKEPLCGWQFYEQHKNDIIPCEFEIITPETKHTIKLNGNKYLNKVIKSTITK